MTTVRNRTVLITGAGGGLGRQLARSFARRGAYVVASDVRLADARRTADELVGCGWPAEAMEMNVADEASIRRVRDALDQAGRRVEILVNNAGLVFGGAFGDVPLERHCRTLEVNALGPVRVTHVFWPHLTTGDQGHVVNIASASAMIGLPFATTYAASKWAVLGFSESLRDELHAVGCRSVHVTAVCPGYIATGMFDGVRPPLLMPWLKPGPLAESIVRAVQRNRDIVRTPWIVKLIPFGRGTMHRKLFRALLRLLRVPQSMVSWRGHAAAARAPSTAPDPQPSAAGSTTRQRPAPAKALLPAPSTGALPAPENA